MTTSEKDFAHSGEQADAHDVPTASAVAPSATGRRPEYERNVVYRSSLTGQWYFAPKVRVLGEGLRCVMGRKYDITAQVEPFLLKKWRRPMNAEGR